MVEAVVTVDVERGARNGDGAYITGRATTAAERASPGAVGSMGQRGNVAFACMVSGPAGVDAFGASEGPQAFAAPTTPRLPATSRGRRRSVGVN